MRQKVRFYLYFTRKIKNTAGNKMKKFKKLRKMIRQHIPPQPSRPTIYVSDITYDNNELFGPSPLPWVNLWNDIVLKK